jgi:hypothetical protein
MRLLVAVACGAAALAHAAVSEGQAASEAPAASSPGAAVPAQREAAPAATAPTWVSTSGSGLLSLPDVATLAKKHLDLGISFDNQDRDPLRLDVVDYSITWDYGLASNAETYGHVVVSRAVIVAERPTMFPPPVDVIVPSGALTPARPYYLLYAPFPYVNRTGSSQFSRFVPGDAVFGGKLRFAKPSGWRPGLAASLELKLPMTRELAKLQSGAGTGGFDQTFRLTAEWRSRRQSLVASAAVTHVGKPPFGDCVIVATPEGATPTAMPILLASRLQLGLGFRHVLKPSVALVAELTKVAPFGEHSVAFEAPGPLDLSAGAQLRWRGLHLTLGVRYHANSIASFGTHPNPFGGMTDLTGVEPGARDAYLTAIGAGPSIPYIRDRSQIAVFTPANGPPLPEGALVLPPIYTVRSHDRIASLLVLGWSFGRKR